MSSDSRDSDPGRSMHQPVADGRLPPPVRRGLLCVVGLVCATVLFVVAFPPIGTRHGVPRWILVKNNVKQVGLAFQLYHRAYNQLPAAVMTDLDGRELNGWRSAVLPFIEEQERWEGWKTAEPWNSDSNTRLHQPVPLVFTSQLDDEPMPTGTHCMTVRDPRGMFPGAQAIRFDEVTDGLMNTLMAVYVHERSVDWASPNDITLQELQAAVANYSSGNPIFFLMGDGAVYTIGTRLGPEQIEAMVTRAGGEDLGKFPGLGK